MGKSIKGKELGKGITQRKSDGLYQGRFVNRFGKTQTIYASSLNELRKRMREEQSSFYYNLFVLAIETGMRIGELCGIQWQDIDFDKKVLYVRHTLCYFQKDGKYIFEMHEAKTKNGRRTIPLTTKALEALKQQRRLF